jgi:hypothetical protein
MGTHYLLPCQCGKKSEIDSNQAGLTVRCACGAELTVPAMRGLASLERVDRAPAPSQAAAATTWGARQGMMFLGGAMAVIAAAAALIFWAQFFEMPTLKPDYQEINREHNEELSLEDSFIHWRERLQTGVEQPEIETGIAMVEQHNEGVMQWEYVCGGFAALGLLLVVVGLLLPSPRSAS